MPWNKVKGSTTEEILGNCPSVDLDCIIIKKGTKFREHLCWNSHHKCWDDSDGDDFMCSPGDVLYWQAFPKLPDELIQELPGNKTTCTCDKCKHSYCKTIAYFCKITGKDFTEQLHVSKEVQEKLKHKDCSLKNQ